VDGVGIKPVGENVNAQSLAPKIQTGALVANKRGRARAIARAAGRGLVYCAVLIPLSIAAVLATLVGQHRAAASWWGRLAKVSPAGGRRPGPVGVLAHALVSLLLGATALIPLGVELIFILRGVLYGFVDRGPYDTSWGGPTRAGAWTVHFLDSLAAALVGLVVLAGIAALHRRLTVSLHGGPRPVWVVLVPLLLAAGGGMLFVAWLHQI
jgi:hypothetical protein